MPIYEFYCESCHTVFNFFSRRINTETIPGCPRCNQPLTRKMSMFATIGKAREESDELPPGVDEHTMEQALGDMMQEAEGMNEDDPRQMAQFMRRFTEKTGLNLGDGMEEALARLEAGEDPEKIEQEMGDIFDGEDPMTLLHKKTAKTGRRAKPFVDETLYDLK